MIVFDGAVAVKEGDSAPDTGGVFARGLGPPSIDDGGDFAFLAPVTGGSATQGVFLHAGGVTSKLVLAGDAAPGAGGGTFFSLAEVSRNSAGDLALLALRELTGGSMVNGVFLLSAGGNVRIAQASDAAPGGGSFLTFSGVDIGDGGEVVFRSNLVSGSGVYLYSGGVLRKVAKNGDAAPGGGTFNSFGAPAIAASGEVVFGANFAGGTSGVFRDAGAGLLKIARAGDAAPGGSTYSSAGAPVDGNDSSDVVFPAFFGSGSSAIVRDDASVQTVVASLGGANSDPEISDAGDVAFVAPLTGSSWGVFVRTGSTTTPVALSGDQVPNSGGAYYGGPVPASLVPAAVGVDDTARVAFAVTLTKDPDLDADGILNVLDKCTLDARNATMPSTCDTDQDGYGNPCDADYDQNFTVNATDFGSYFIPAFKGLVPPSHGEDMDCNFTSGAGDFGAYFVPKFKGALGGAIPGPSGLPCAGTPGCS